MVFLPFVFAVVTINCVYGRPPLPPLAMKDGCYLVDPEVNIFRVEGEAVILSFPIFTRVLEVRKIALPVAEYLITKDIGAEGTSDQGVGRVQQQNNQLWFLPALASDSGEYTCTYRNETYCITGSITLHVYEPTSVDMKTLPYSATATVGKKFKLGCPSLRNFNKTDSLIEWYKDSNTTVKHQGELIIPAVKQSHAGVYTCKLRVRINNQQYKVSRVLLLHVQDPATTTKSTVPEVSVTSDPEPISTSSINTPVFHPPVIVSPLNGTIFESPRGSVLELFCEVLTECQMADSTKVTWLVNSQSVESSYLDKRALQGGRRVTRVSKGCQIELRLIVEAITEEDEKTELKCVTQNKSGRQEVVALLRLEDSTFTWLVVAVVAVTSFLTVVSVFLYVLFKPKRKKNMDYFLARQSSTF
ncbi:interleukin-1 receptor type 2-like [Archocentrus centrarchus]|uniref:interleukin-1 receptor type 2-like n=1 Tax=Archocentrus centrarchus TaxID=63155 RepID=UPI0011E9D084|nr:interleukin-1 receptor type 2-like [Archocentrus centrarchus]